MADKQLVCWKVVTAVTDEPISTRMPAALPTSYPAVFNPLPVDTYVVAESLEDVCRLYPDAVRIERLGAAKVVDPDALGG